MTQTLAEFGMQGVSWKDKQCDACAQVSQQCQEIVHQQRILIERMNEEHEKVQNEKNSEIQYLKV